MRATRPVWLLLVAASAASFSAGPATGQNASEKAAAEALFVEGRRLMASGGFAAACEKFDASQKLDPALGTMLNLADCYEKVGRTASAWAIFHEAAAAAGASGAYTRQQFARDRAASLEERLSTLTIRAETNTHVLRDGRRVEPAMLGVPIPVDPGKHVIMATEQGREVWSQTVEVSRDRTHVDLQVPPSTPARSAPPAAGSSAPSGPTAAVVGSAPRPPPQVQAPPPASGKGQQIVAIGVGVLGVAGVGLGAYLATRAASSLNDVKAHCVSYPDQCTPEAQTPWNDASEAGNFATVSFVVGAAGLAGAALLWFSAPKPGLWSPASSATSSAPRVQVGPTSVLLRGTF